MEDRRIDALDGLRGLAAAWVLIGHACQLAGLAFHPVFDPRHAVDLFMMLSGFLMTFHYQDRAAAEPWAASSTWGRFWTRRFFRIAPLYYVILALALLAGPLIGGFREHVALFVPDVAAPTERYEDASLGNILAHLSFVFGVSPYYHARTLLPDWSISLEMQFYAVFPFLMLLISRVGFIAGAIVLAVACYALSGLSFFGEFERPSILPLKLHIFLAGMLLAASLRAKPLHAALYVAVAVVIAAAPIVVFWRAIPVRMALVLGLAVVLHCNRWGWLTPVRPVARMMGGRLGHFVGEMSYGVYLLHLFLLIPAASLAHDRLSAGPLVKAVVILLVVTPLTYGLAALFHLAIEKPGIAAGKRVLRRRRERLAQAG